MWSGGAFFESQNAKIVALSAVRLVGLRLEGGALSDEQKDLAITLFAMESDLKAIKNTRQRLC